MRAIWISLLCCLLVGLAPPGCKSYRGGEAFLKAHALDSFVADRPQAAKLIGQYPALEQWLRTEWNQPIEQCHLIWSDNDPIDSPLAEHSPAPRDHLITIRVSKKALPADQLLALSFETFNAQGLPRFNALAAQAASGKITREDFVSEVEETEYKAVLRMKETFPKLMPLANNEVTALYRGLLEIPVGFREYQMWSVRTHNEDYIRAHDLYARRYDQIVKGR